jgi:Trypsin
MVGRTATPANGNASGACRAAVGRICLARAAGACPGNVRISDSRPAAGRNPDSGSAKRAGSLDAHAGLGVALDRGMIHLLPVLLSSTTSVTGGTAVEPGHWRDAVAVLSLTTACTGTLITPDVVLTSRHCLDPEPVYVVLDTIDFTRTGGEAIRVKWSAAYPGGDDAYDVGVVVLDRPATTAPRAIAGACAVRAGLVEGGKLHLVGFGVSEPAGGGPSSQLHEGTISIADAACNDPAACAPRVSPGGEFIAGAGSIDACFGDAGGPAYLDVPGGAALVGVVSRALPGNGPPCGSGWVYVRADQVVPWIEQVTHETVQRTPCLGDADPVIRVLDPAPETGGCAAGGGAGGSLVLGLGLVTAAGVHRRRARAIRLASIGIVGAR